LRRTRAKTGGNHNASKYELTTDYECAECGNYAYWASGLGFMCMTCGAKAGIFDKDKDIKFPSV